MYFARKITYSKWKSADRSLPDEQFLGPLESDLVVHDGKLSIWACGDADAPELEDVVLALATAKDRLDKVDLAWVSNTQLEALDLEWEFSEGRTAVVGIKNLHVTLKGLDRPKRAAFARVVKTSIDQGRWKRYRKHNVREIVLRALNSGRFTHRDVDERLADELSRPES